MLNQIGFFHLDNLVKNRIPFVFINMTNEDVSTFYESIYKMHVQANQKMISAEEALKQYVNPKVSKDTAFVLMCADGAKSSQLAIEFEENGYTNVYVIDGGYQQLMTERAQL